MVAKKSLGSWFNPSKGISLVFKAKIEETLIALFMIHGQFCQMFLRSRENEIFLFKIILLSAKEKEREKQSRTERDCVCVLERERERERERQAE